MWTREDNCLDRPNAGHDPSMVPDERPRGDQKGQGKVNKTTSQRIQLKGVMLTQSIAKARLNSKKKEQEGGTRRIKYSRDLRCAHVWPNPGEGVKVVPTGTKRDDEREGGVRQLGQAHGSADQLKQNNR